MKKVLLVEKSHLVQEICRDILKKEGFEDIDIVSSRKELEEKLEEGKYDIVILNYVLEDIDGVQELKRIRERDKRIGVIMLTSTEKDEDEVMKLLEEGLDDYVVKTRADILARTLKDSLSSLIIKLDTKILVIEDDPLQRQVLEDTLRKIGFRQVETAEDGERGMELFKEKGYDLVFLDYLLPGINGLEVLEKIKTEREETHVIMVTVVDDEVVAKKAKKKGAGDYIIKPFTMKQIEDVALKVLRIERSEKNGEKRLKELKGEILKVIFTLDKKLEFIKKRAQRVLEDELVNVEITSQEIIMEVAECKKLTKKLLEEYLQDVSAHSSGG
ncbi:MAG: response regulator [Synergistetes bacterium]|nr:response regulator [Synergistota bacterium]